MKFLISLFLLPILLIGGCGNPTCDKARIEETNYLNLKNKWISEIEKVGNLLEEGVRDACSNWTEGDAEKNFSSWWDLYCEQWNLGRPIPTKDPYLESLQQKYEGAWKNYQINNSAWSTIVQTYKECFDPKKVLEAIQTENG